MSVSARSSHVKLHGMKGVLLNMMVSLTRRLQRCVDSRIKVASECVSTSTSSYFTVNNTSKWDRSHLRHAERLFFNGAKHWPFKATRRLFQCTNSEVNEMRKAVISHLLTETSDEDIEGEKIPIFRHKFCSDKNLHADFIQADHSNAYLRWEALHGFILCCVSELHDKDDMQDLNTWLVDH
jgi:hypothetical protein